MNRKQKVITAAGVGVAAVLAVGGVAAASGTGGTDPGGEGDSTVTGAQADQATAAALALTGGGHANSVERDSENGATWEVEVTKPGGATVDVRLDQDFGLVVIEGDSESG